MEDTQHRVGARIRHLRRDRGFTQEQLGERAGLSYKFVGEVERGVGNPTVSSLEAIAKALDLPVGELFVDDRQPAAFATLSPRDYATVREARDSLGDMLDRSNPRMRPKRRRPKAR